jgi:hypothetical protein
MSLSIDPPPYPVILNQPRFWQSLRVGSRKSDWFNALGLTAGASIRLRLRLYFDLVSFQWLQFHLVLDFSGLARALDAV